MVLFVFNENTNLRGWGKDRFEKSWREVNIITKTYKAQTLEKIILKNKNFEIIMIFLNNKN